MLKRVAFILILSSVFLVSFVTQESIAVKSDPSLRKKLRKSIRRKQIKISEEFKEQLIQIVQKMSSIHEALSAKKRSLQSKRMQDLINYLQELSFSKEPLSYHHRAYLTKQIQLIQDGLRFIIQESRSEERRAATLKQIYREVIQMYKTHSLQKNLPNEVIFYCPKDSSVWIQNAQLRTYHPFNPSLRRCGVRTK